MLALVDELFLKLKPLLGKLQRAKWMPVGRETRPAWDNQMADSGNLLTRWFAHRGWRVGRDA